MTRIDTLFSYHHKFRFLLEELSDESAVVLKKNRLVEEFLNELEVYRSASISYYMDVTNKRHADQYNLVVEKGENIKRLLNELVLSSQDATNWNTQIMRLKKEMENLLMQFENSIGLNPYMSTNS